PQDAARIANALVEAFEERSQLMNTMDVRAARELIEEQLIQFEADLAAAEEALVRFQQTEQIVTPSGEMAAVLGSISRLEERRAEAMVARETAIKRLEALHAGEFAEENRSVTSSAVVQANP